MSDNALATTEEKVSNRIVINKLLNTSATRQMLLLVGVAAAVALGVAVVLWSRGPNYALLYAGLEDKDAAAVVQALQTANVPYTLAQDGSSIMVPASELASTRLKLAAQGLPEGKAASTAAKDSASPFGMSDLAERTHYQQALETDLGNTIAGLKSVRAARVHLALPKPSAFIRDNHDASASVLVTLYPGRRLDPSQVAAIVHLVSSSVPNLEAKQVSVVDQDGQLLTSGDGANPHGEDDSRLKLQTRIENSYAQRIEELLTPIVGPGKVHAQVSADLDFRQTDQATESFGKDGVLRSEQTASNSRTGMANDGGVAGALSNQPPNTVVQPTAAKPNQGKTVLGNSAATGTGQANGPSESSNNATRNFEIDRTISHVSDPAGRIARLSVAVVVDNKTVAGDKGVSKSVPLTQQELAHLTTLARNAVGFNTARGDELNVINEAFHPDAISGSVPEPSFWDRPGLLDLIKQGVGILIALAVAFFVLRPMLKGLTKPAPSRELVVASGGAASDVVPTVRAHVIEDDFEDEIVRLSQPPLPAADPRQGRLQRARDLVIQDPKQMAQIVKNWVVQDGE